MLFSAGEAGGASARPGAAAPSPKRDSVATRTRFDRIITGSLSKGAEAERFLDRELAIHSRASVYEKSSAQPEHPVKGRGIAAAPRCGRSAELRDRAGARAARLARIHVAAVAAVLGGVDERERPAAGPVVRVDAVTDARVEHGGIGQDAAHRASRDVRDVVTGPAAVGEAGRVVVRRV